VILSAFLILFSSFFMLLYEFADCYSYRYLSYIMDVATPTADWLNLVHELLLPVLMKNHGTAALSHQEVYFSLPLDALFSGSLCFWHANAFRRFSVSVRLFDQINLPR
jgi:hypothetical protein